MDAELLQAYLDDVGRCVTSLEEAILNCESGAGPAALNQVCRDLHTLKGASASVGLGQLADYLHRVEDHIQAVSGDAAPADLDIVLQAVDAVRAQMTLLGETSDRPESASRPSAAEAMPSAGANFAGAASNIALCAALAN